MNIHDEIKKLAPNLHKTFKGGDMYFVGDTYKVGKSPTKERVRINKSGAIVLVIDSEIGKHFSKILKEKGVPYNVDKGRYRSYNATDLRKAGLFDSYSTLQSPEILAEEILEPEKFTEGATKTISVNIYERDRDAREQCIQHYGNSCTVCGFNFKDVFGELGEDYIHVHHLTQLSDIGREYKVNPKKDLRPVCPNCHAMLHRKKEPLSIEELKQIRKRANNK